MVFYPGVVFSIPDNDEDTVTSKKVKKVAATTKGVNSDSDGDGVPDSSDECPSIPGPAATNGCPDSDGDGIPDHLDDCPTVFGLAQYRGCPDTDLDGIPDNKDVCPYEAGPESNNGCPLPDSSKQMVIAKVLDTLDFKEERDMLLMRYERYLYEQEINPEVTKLKPEVAEAKSVEKEKTKLVADNVENKVSKPEVENKVGKPEVENKTVKTEPKTLASSVTINSAQFQSFKPKLEALLKDMRFQNGRVFFVDENKSFEALHELASYCASYPEWVKIIFHCYSNETDNAYGNKQLFSNRAYTLKQILVSDLHISEKRLDFVNKINADSNISNYISLEINTK
jgi:hypothetical protein